MQDAKLVEIYSDSLYRQSIDDKSLDNVVTNMKNIIDIIESSPNLRRFLTAPIYDNHKKMRLLEMLDSKMVMEKITKNFLKTLVENHRFKYFENIYKKLSEKKLLAEGITPAILTSARDMTRTDIEECQEMLEKKLEKKFAIKHVVDPSIIGGFVLSFGSNLYDLSVAGAGKILSREINEA
jgi:F-type H+-transporting ATPase subunit delta